MDLDFFYRSLRVSLWMVFLAALCGWAFTDWIWAAQFCLFGFWAVLNLLCLGRLIMAFWARQDLFKAGLWLLGNVGMLAALFVAFALLTHYRQLRISAFLIAFNAPFFVFLLRGLGAVMVAANARSEQPGTTIKGQDPKVDGRSDS